MRKMACTQGGYAKAIREAGGVENLTVLSSYTYIDDPGTTPMGPGRHVYTEWGTKDGAFVAEHEEHNGDHTYRIAHVKCPRCGGSGWCEQDAGWCTECRDA